MLILAPVADPGAVADDRRAVDPDPRAQLDPGADQRRRLDLGPVRGRWRRGCPGETSGAPGIDLDLAGERVECCPGAARRGCLCRSSRHRSRASRRGRRSRAARGRRPSPSRRTPPGRPARRACSPRPRRGSGRRSPSRTCRCRSWPGRRAPRRGRASPESPGCGPSEPVMTTPNWLVSATRLVARVAIPSWESWNSRIAARSMSVRASPEITRKESPRKPAAWRTPPAVPSSCLLLAVGEVDAELASRRRSGRGSAPGTSAGWRSPRSKPCRESSRAMCSITGRLSTGTIGFGRS